MSAPVSMIHFFRENSLMNPCKALRQRLLPGQFSSIAGAYDMLSARLAVQAGCEVLHVGGYNLSAVRLGQPDVGLLTLSENVEMAGRIAASTDVPVIADGDDGYGNHLNVDRLIRELERAGLAGVHLEDQVFPKRCGHMAGKRVVPAALMVDKIRAAVDARGNADFVIIARTDALATESFEAVLERAGAYREAGADMLFIEAPRNNDEVARIPQAVNAPTLFNWCLGGLSPTPEVAEVKRLGYSMILFTDVLFAVAPMLARLYENIAAGRGYGPRTTEMMGVGAFNEMIGLSRIEALDRRYGRHEDPDAAPDDARTH